MRLCQGVKVSLVVQRERRVDVIPQNGEGGAAQGTHLIEFGVEVLKVGLRVVENL